MERSRPRRLRWVAALAFALVAAIFYRSLAVAPGRAARGQAEQASERAAPILARLALPMQSLPHFAVPASGLPASGATLSPEDSVTLSELAQALTLAAAAAPAEASVSAAAGPIHLALGDERAARRAWESVLAHAPPEDQDIARVGLAVLAVRVALRSVDEQDRGFALDVALHELDFVREGSPLWGHRLFEEVVVRSVQGHEAAADAALLELSGLSTPEATHGVPLLRDLRREGAALLGFDPGGEARSRDTQPAPSARPARDADAHDQE